MAERVTGLWVQPPANDIFMCSLPDTIYEDVQRDGGGCGGSVHAGNGWSSSEFESYDDQSDNDTKLPTRSKVALACVCTHACMPDACVYPQ